MIFDKTQALIGRLLIALLFILAGIAKILGPQSFIAHMNEFGVPSVLLPLVIALEVGAGLAIAFGWRVRETATALGFFACSRRSSFIMTSRTRRNGRSSSRISRSPAGCFPSRRIRPWPAAHGSKTPPDYRPLTSMLQHDGLR
jgi:hypothetical protein